MIIMQDHASTRRPDNRAWYASLLARYAANRRAELGLTVEQAAELSGMEVSEWHAIEAGALPSEMSTIRSIATTLQVRWTDLHMLIFVADCAA